MTEEFQNDKLQREAVFEEFENFPESMKDINFRCRQQNKSPSIINRNKYKPEHMVNHQRQRDSSNQRLPEVDYLQRATPRQPIQLQLLSLEDEGIIFSENWGRGRAVNQFTDSREQNGLGWLAQGWLRASP